MSRPWPSFRDAASVGYHGLVHRTAVAAAVTLTFTFTCAFGACAVRPPEPDGSVYGLDAANPADSGTLDAARTQRTTPYPHWDLSVELPYGAPEQTAALNVVALAGRVDLHLLVDTTQSFDGEISQLQRTLTSSVLPQLRARVTSLSVGVSSFQDMPFAPFGLPSDRPFTLHVAQTSNSVRVLGAVQQLNRPLGNGGDRPESWAEALYQVATGAGLDVGTVVLASPFSPQSLPDTGSLGGVGFREHSSRVVVLITDAPTHDASDYAGVVPHAHTLTAAVTALTTLRARVVGIASASDARPGIEQLAMATGGVTQPVDGACNTGLSGATHAPVRGVCPLVYDLLPDGTGLSATLVDGLFHLLDAAVYDDMHAESEADVRQFVTSMEAVSAVTPDGSTPPPHSDRRPAGRLDGVDDTFLSVRANVQLMFQLHLRNLMVPDDEFPQVFFVPITVLGDGVVVRQIIVRVIVPERPKSDVVTLERDATIE